MRRETPMVLTAVAIVVVTTAIGLLYKRNTIVVPTVATWDLPSCPQELTLQNGSRWAMPAWSEPACEATIEWTVTPIKAVPVNP